MKEQKRMKDIRIEWEGPYSLEDIGYREGTYSLSNAKVNEEPEDHGVYQIYGSHPIYGSNVLLYIGQANDQTFAKRISQEAWECNEDYKNIQIYVGYIYNNGNYHPLNDDDVWGKAIEDAERMLIYSHEPARNSSNILNISRNQNKLKDMEDIRVFNYGCYRSLMPEVSGEMWIKEFGDIKLFGNK